MSRLFKGFFPVKNQQISNPSKHLLWKYHIVEKYLGIFSQIFFKDNFAMKEKNVIYFDNVIFVTENRPVNSDY